MNDKNENEYEIIDDTDRGAKSDEDVRSQQAEDAKQFDTENTDDVEFEEVNEDGVSREASAEWEEVDTKTTIKKLREKLKKVEAEKKEYLDLSQRLRADYMNFKKEVDENRVSDRKHSTKRFIESLLPVLDAYDMAKGNKEAWEKVDQNWRIGIEYIFGQFRKVLEDEGVVQFAQVGDEFNPNLHESIEMVKVENESENGKIVRVMQSGYKMHENILRPARVHVAQFEK